jgi:hypothetical protein
LSAISAALLSLSAHGDRLTDDLFGKEEHPFAQSKQHNNSIDIAVEAKALISFSE